MTPGTSLCSDCLGFGCMKPVWKQADSNYGAVASLCLAPRNLNVEACNAYRENSQENLKMNDVDKLYRPSHYKCAIFGEG